MILAGSWNSHELSKYFPSKWMDRLYQMVGTWTDQLLEQDNDPKHTTKLPLGGLHYGFWIA